MKLPLEECAVNPFQRKNGTLSFLFHALFPKAVAPEDVCTPSEDHLFGDLGRLAHTYSLQLSELQVVAVNIGTFSV
jgi:hypothetical protein